MQDSNPTFGRNDRNAIRVALGSVPKDGGTFTFYRNMRAPLLENGVDLSCVTVGSREASLIEPEFADEGCVLIAPDSGRIQDQAVAFAEWCARESVDIVIGLNSVAILSAIPHLPANVRVVARCANGFEHGYAITLAGRERLYGVVALTPKLRDDLIFEFGVDADTVDLIPNGTSPTRFADAADRPRGLGDKLEIGYLGRLEHMQKGVLHIPKIVRHLTRSGVPFRLRIAGKGKHESQLRSYLSEESAEGIVSFEGALGPDEIAGFLGGLDVFLFTSHFEGCPNALIEAMMSGCVPVASRICGTTDFLIEDGRTGFVCDVENHAEFADRIARLHRDRPLLSHMSTSAATFARAALDNRITAQAYCDLFEAVMRAPPLSVQPKPWSEFRVFEPFDPSYAQRLRDKVKRTWRDIRIKRDMSA